MRCWRGQWLLTSPSKENFSNSQPEIPTEQRTTQGQHGFVSFLSFQKFLLKFLKFARFLILLSIILGPSKQQLYSFQQVMDLDHVVCQNKVFQMIMKKKLYLCFHGSFRFRISSCLEHFLPLQEMLFQWRSPNSTHISRRKRRSRHHKKSNCTAAICLRNIDIFYIFIKTKNVSSFIFIYKLYIILYI